MTRFRVSEVEENMQRSLRNNTRFVDSSRCVRCFQHARPSEPKLRDFMARAACLVVQCGPHDIMKAFHAVQTTATVFIRSLLMTVPFLCRSPCNYHRLHHAVMWWYLLLFLKFYQDSIVETLPELMAAAHQTMFPRVTCSASVISARLKSAIKVGYIRFS